MSAKKLPGSLIYNNNTTHTHVPRVMRLKPVFSCFREILLEIACFCTKTYLRIEFSEKIREAGL